MACNSLNCTPFVNSLLYVCLSNLLHFFEVCVLHILFAIVVGLLTGTGACLLTSLSALCVHLGTGCLEGCVQFVHSSINSSKVLTLVPANKLTKTARKTFRMLTLRKSSSLR